MWHEHIVPFFTDNPSMLIFLTLCLGYLIGKLKYKMLTLGTVTSVLLVGVVLGIIFPGVHIMPPLKNLFFLLFLFAIGYTVGPQFFNSFKKTGLPQVLFAVVMCALCLISTWVVALMAKYNAGEAAGLFAGSQTMSAVIGVAQETLKGLHFSDKELDSMFNIMPVVYAVAYIYGTAGSAWIVAILGPKLYGGLKHCQEMCAKEEAAMGENLADQPGFTSSLREVAFRCYTVDNDWFGDKGRSVSELEEYVKTQNRRLFVERIRHNGDITETPGHDTLIYKGDQVVLSGRREFIVGEEKWIGPETIDPQLLNFAVREQPVLVSAKDVKGHTVGELFAQPFMHGVCIRNIKRGENTWVPVRTNAVIEGGDVLTLMGLPYDVQNASAKIGHAARQTSATDMIFLTLGLLLGGILGYLSFKAGNVPVSLTVSGGVLIMGLIFGWWHSRRPDYGQIPQASTWIFKELGLNTFIACIGLECGPNFLTGFEKVGFILFAWGAIATTLPLVLGTLLARFVFKFSPGVGLGCVAGSRTTTAALGALEEQLHSGVPAMGYAITYAVGNTLLILFGVVMVLLMT